MASKDNLRLLVLFVCWYGFNAGYNVLNSRLKVFPHPITISMIQLVIGLGYSIPLWILGIRKAPKLTLPDLWHLLPIAVLNAVGHTTTVIAMFQVGGGSFAHVIKASEPVVSVILGLVVNGAVPRPWTALSLLPICYGVAFASTLGNLNLATMAKEFATLAAVMAMVGNIAFVLRSLCRKNLPADFKARTNLDAVNDHAVTTLLSALLTLPACVAFEGPVVLQQLTEQMGTSQSFLTNLVGCSLCFYLYNEMQNVVLGSLGPVPTAVGNTLKRVAIFVALYLFTEGESFPLPKVVGCGIAIAGCLAYAVCESRKM